LDIKGGGVAEAPAIDIKTTTRLFVRGQFFFYLGDFVFMRSACLRVIGYNFIG